MSYNSFFVRCEIEPITDLRTFVTRLARLERVIELQATVKPPNPLSGPCWKSLNDYMKKRQLDEVQVKEDSASGIITNVTQIAQAMDSTSASPTQIRK